MWIFWVSHGLRRDQFSSPSASERDISKPGFVEAGNIDVAGFSVVMGEVL